MKYKVKVHKIITHVIYVEVEADSEDDAIEQAEDLAREESMAELEDEEYEVMDVEEL